MPARPREARTAVGHEQRLQTVLPMVEPRPQRVEVEQVAAGTPVSKHGEARPLPGMTTLRDVPPPRGSERRCIDVDRLAPRGDRGCPTDVLRLAPDRGALAVAELLPERGQQLNGIGTGALLLGPRRFEYAKCRERARVVAVAQS